jgi:citrate lyase beta subunit
VYVPAPAVTADLPARFGAAALAALDAHAGSPAAFAALVGVPAELADGVWDRVRATLATRPVQDLRVDLEDGYGRHPDAAEDAAAAGAGDALAALLRRPDAPFCFGIRCKALEPATRARGLRSLTLFCTALVSELGPDSTALAGLRVTVPKVMAVAHVEAMVLVAAHLETQLGMTPGTVRLELQIEQPQAVVAADGTVPLGPMIAAGAGRVVGLHYGTYDYSAALGVPAADQSLDHPVAEAAKAVLQIAAAGTGVDVSDGSTNLLPVGDGDAVRAAWALHARLVRHGLRRGIAQGWDLHPAQLPTRYATVYAFHRAALPAATARLRAYVAGAAGGTLDEPATAQALAGALLRGLDCGALTPGEVTAGCGLDRPALLRLVRRQA